MPCPQSNPSSGWASLGRPPTPEGAVSLTPPVQQPTRSLWVGNLDPKTTPADLQEVFAPYGAIESLRLIPDKVRLPPSATQLPSTLLSLCSPE